MQLSQAIKDYTAGRSNLGEFRLALAGKITIDGKLERLIRQHEAGDSVSFATLGSLIFRQIEGSCDNYNRVDKISLNNAKQVGLDQPIGSFTESSKVPRRKKKITDSMQVEEEWRNSTGVYQ